MIYAWKENSLLTNCLAACAHLTITVSEIERDIGRQSSFFSYPFAFDALVKGVSIGISPPRLVSEKLEWCGYPMVKKFQRYVYSFWHDSRTWRTDGRTPHANIGRAYASHRAAKTDKSPGLDQLHPRALYECREVISYPLYIIIIYIKSLSLGILPTDWKLAEVTALYKKGSKSDGKLQASQFNQRVL